MGRRKRATATVQGLMTFVSVRGKSNRPWTICASGTKFTNGHGNGRDGSGGSLKVDGFSASYFLSLDIFVLFLESVRCYSAACFCFLFFSLFFSGNNESSLILNYGYRILTECVDLLFSWCRRQASLTIDLDYRCCLRKTFRPQTTWPTFARFWKVWRRSAFCHSLPSLMIIHRE